MDTQKNTNTGANGAEEWAEKDRRYVWHSMSRVNPGSGQASTAMMVEEGSGAWISDTMGNRYLDGMSGLWCVNVGYGREELARAAYDQLVKLPYYPLTMSHKPAVELAEKLNEWLDDEYVIYYSNSGSEANEVAFKVARQFHEQNGEPGRHKFVSRYRAYHGNTMGALAATGQAQRKFRYEPLAPGFLHVQPPDRYRCAYCSDRPACNLECAGEIERTIQWELPETVAGVIMEPMITGGGILIPPDGYVEEVARICERTGALLIIDEVISGFGRTGKKFGHQHYGIKPDIVTMAKGITSAYLPLSATAVKRELFEKFMDTEEYAHFRHVNTFGGNATACALAIRNLQIMEDEELPERSAAMGEKLMDALSSLRDHPNVGQIRGKGLLVGIELVEDKESKAPASAEKVGKVVSGCKERGLIVGKNGDTVAGFNNVVTLAPPLVVTDEDLAFIVETLKESVNGL
ncbi:MAG: aspartate aminotransferase family protein [Actinobacteria bacterium]|nr:aspartate aminotransferase family protein [Actinomycetota bacterium]PLS85050.1 MAG: aspartate aminotransferase family protein [Actinomycetota bacterium]